MTALRAFQHGKKVGVVARTRSHAPFAADVIPMIEQDPANDGQTLPAPTSPTAPSLTTPDGTRLVAGLTWEIASGPETPVVRPDAPLVLRLPERRAQLALTARTARTDSAASSLLLAMGDALTRIAPDAKGTWAFLVAFPVELRDPESDFDGDPLLWLALADLGAPDADAADTPAATLPRPGPLHRNSCFPIRTRRSPRFTSISPPPRSPGSASHGCRRKAVIGAASFRVSPISHRHCPLRTWTCTRCPIIRGSSCPASCRRAGFRPGCLAVSGVGSRCCWPGSSWVFRCSGKRSALHHRRRRKW